MKASKRRSPIFRCSLAIALPLVFLCDLSSIARADKPWKAGAATIVITPPQLMWMSGYGGRTKRAEGVEHDLRGKALVIEDPQGQRAVLVTLDLVGIDRGTSVAVCNEITKKYSLSRDRMILNCSHNHCGPVVGRNLENLYFLDPADQQLVDEYAVWLRKQIVSVVGRAIDKLEPSALVYGEGYSTIAVNRRNNPHDKVVQLREQGDLRGPVDHSVPVLRVSNSRKQITAIVFGYACHPTKLTKFYRFCGDYVGFAQLELEKHHAGAVAMFWQGCGGDQTPWPRGENDIQATQEVGQAVAQAVETALKQPLTPIRGRLQTTYREIELKLSKLPSRAELESQSRSPNRYLARQAKQLLATLDAGNKLQQSYTNYPIQTWRIGDDLSFIALGGEVVVDYSIRVKDEMGSQKVWVAGYSNDVMAYIPSRRVLMEGGYEGRTSMPYYGFPAPWALEIEEAIVEEVRRQITSTSK